MYAAMYIYVAVTNWVSRVGLLETFLWSVIVVGVGSILYQFWRL